MPEKTWSPETVLDVFGDPVARATLVMASDQRVTVQAISDRLDVSEPTIYRRINALVEANLLFTHQQIDEPGNQPSEYETRIDSVTVDVDSDGYTVDITFQQDSESLESLWSDLERISHHVDNVPETVPGRISNGDRDTT